MSGRVTKTVLELVGGRPQAIYKQNVDAMDKTLTTFNLQPAQVLFLFFGGLYDPARKIPLRVGSSPRPEKTSIPICTTKSTTIQHAENVRVFVNLSNWNKGRDAHFVECEEKWKVSSQVVNGEKVNTHQLLCSHRQLEDGIQRGMVNHCPTYSLSLQTFSSQL